jgi:hypothetical protein
MAKETKISFQDLEAGKLEALLLKIQPLLEPADFQLLDRVICTLLLVLDCIQKKNMSIRRLLRMIFAPKTESSRNLLPKDKAKDYSNAPLVVKMMSYAKKDGKLTKDDLTDTRLQRLFEAAEKAKVELSSVTQTSISLPFVTADATGPKHLNTTLTRAKFDQLTADLVQRTVKPVEEAMADAKLTA